MISNCDFSKTPEPEHPTPVVDPIIVYQMGKVGSDSIVHWLGQLGLSNSVHHIHILSHNNIQQSLDNLSQHNRPLPIQAQHSIAVREFLDRSDASPVQVITSVREPISQLISSEFQNIPMQHPDLIDEHGEWKQQLILDHLMQRVESYDVNREWNCNWFDFDFRPALGIDIYEQAFDVESGIATFQQNEIRVLVLRLESSEHWSRSIQDFLGLDSDLELTQQNSAANKNYKRVYESVTANLRFTESTLDRVYSSKYCRHFYSSAMIETFKTKWRVDTAMSTRLRTA